MIKLDLQALSALKIIFNNNYLNRLYTKEVEYF
jgi:hypothetical protein